MPYRDRKVGTLVETGFTSTSGIKESKLDDLRKKHTPERREGTMPQAAATGAPVAGATCPHGFPIGACPICNGTGGGGGSSVKKSNAGEWSYAKCYSVGMQMRYRESLEQANARVLQSLSAQAENAANFLKTMKENFAARIETLAQMLPQPVATVVKVLNAVVFMPILTIAIKFAEFTAALTRGAEFFKGQLINLGEKLAAIFGEVKNFVKEKAEKAIKAIKKNVSKLFKAIFGGEEDETETKEALTAHLSKGA